VSDSPYLSSPPSSRGRNPALIRGLTAILMTCCCLTIFVVYIVLVDPFHWKLTASSLATATSSALHTPTRTATHTPKATSTNTHTPTLSPSPTPAPPITATPTPTTPPTPTSTDTSTQPVRSRLTVCMAIEPQTLFIYSAASYEQKAILDVILDGPIDYRTYEYVPVILEELPTIENGGATVQEITVHTNDKYVDENDNIVRWYGMQTQMDQLVATFQLKDGLLWSDGTPLTADDSLFGYEIARDTPSSAAIYTDMAERTASYTVLDSQTVQWVGLPGYIDPSYSTNFFPPVSRQAYGMLTPEQMMNDPRVNITPLGWGPFRIVKWELGKEITLERNPFYFRSREGLPYLDEVVFRFVPGDQILPKMLNGTCDVGAQDANWENQLDNLRSTELTGAIVPQYVPYAFFEHLDFNIQPLESPLTDFANVSIRQAVAYCLDRQAIIDEVWYGLSTPPDSFLPPEHPLYNSEITKYEFDPQKGLALLKDAGWEDHDGDQILDRNGYNFAISLYTRNNLRRDQIAPLIAGQLRDNCEMDVTVGYYTSQELFGTFPDGLLAGRQFDLAEFYWSTTAGWQTCELFLSANIPSDENPSGINYTGYANPDYDTACMAGMTSLDFTQRLVNYRQTQAIFATELPSLPLFWRLKITVTLPGASDLILDPSAASEFWNIEQVRLTP
jgi:peptide/nickel transport system substrate-binding protein